MSGEANEDVTRRDARVVEFNDTENWGERDEKRGTGTEMRGSLEGVRDEMRGHTESCDPKNARENQNQKVVIDYETSVDLFSVTRQVRQGVASVSIRLCPGMDSTHQKSITHQLQNNRCSGSHRLIPHRGMCREVCC